MNIQLRSYLEAELSKARVEEGRLTLEITAAQKQLDDLTRQMDDRSALIAGMRKLLAKADADEVASPAKKDASDQAQEEPEPVSMDAVWRFRIPQMGLLTDEQKAKAKKDAQEGDKSQTINVAASLSTEEKTGE